MEAARVRRSEGSVASNSRLVYVLGAVQFLAADAKQKLHGHAAQ